MTANNVTEPVVSRRHLFAGLGAALLSGSAAGMWLWAPKAYAETSAEVRAQANEVLERLQALQEDLDIKSNAYFQALEEEETAIGLMEDAMRRIQECEDEILKLKHRLATRVKSNYKTGNTSFLDILFGSTSFAAFINNVDIMNQMNENDVDTVQKTVELRAEIELERQEYERQAAIAKEKREEAEAIKDEAQAIVDEVHSIWAALDSKANALLRAEIAAEQERRRREEEERRRQEQAAMGNDTGAQAGNDWTDTGNTVVDRAGRWIGHAEYVWAACAPGAFDCSGFVAYCVTGVYRRIGTTWNFVTNTSLFQPLTWDQARPGDICVVHNNYKQHTGIYYGGNYMIHCADYGVGVILGWFDRNVYQPVRYAYTVW